MRVPRAVFPVGGPCSSATSWRGRSSRSSRFLRHRFHGRPLRCGLTARSYSICKPHASRRWRRMKRRSTAWWQRRWRSRESRRRPRICASRASVKRTRRPISGACAAPRSTCARVTSTRLISRAPGTCSSGRRDSQAAFRRLRTQALPPHSMSGCVRLTPPPLRHSRSGRGSRSSAHRLSGWCGLMAAGSTHVPLPGRVPAAGILPASVGK